MTTPQNLQQDLIHLKNRGYSSRFLAEKFLGSSKKKSTVNDIVARYVKENGNAYDKQEVEQRKASCIEDLGYYKKPQDKNSWKALEDAYYKKKIYKDEVEKEYYEGFAYRGNKLPEHEDILEPIPGDWYDKLVEKYGVKKPYVKPKVTKEGSLKIMFIPDSQVRPGESTNYLAAIGQYIVDKKPDVVVCAGDFWDFPSLSSYDKGKTAFEGRRLYW